MNSPEEHVMCSARMNTSSAEFCSTVLIQPGMNVVLVYSLNDPMVLTALNDTVFYNRRPCLVVAIDENLAD